MKILSQYRRAFEEVVNEFVSKYYTYDDWSCQDYHIIGDGGRLAPCVVSVWDEFWSIENMYEALYHNIPMDLLLEWYYDIHINMDKNVQRVNLVTYCVWMIRCSKSDLKKSAKSAKKAWKILYKIIKDNEKN